MYTPTNMKGKLNGGAERRDIFAARHRYSASDLSGRQRSFSRLRPEKEAVKGQVMAAAPARSRRRPWLRRVLLTLVLTATITGGVFGYKVIAASNSITTADRSILGQLKDLLFSGSSLLAGESQDRINVLLMAIGGEGHKGEDLADTIIIASYRPSTNKAALLSIPRDLYVQVPGREYYSKINAVHAYGESQEKNEGPELMKELVEDITSLPIHYHIRVDFTAFKNIIDAIGGINITIDQSFYDYWHKISFPAGTEKMNGERALAYVRARYIEGPQGGDFKRAQRQQQVLLALRDKVFSVQTALNFAKVNAILNSLADNIRTDMELWEMKRFYEMARLVDRSQVQAVVLSSGPKGVLTGSTEVLGGEPTSVLHPRTGNYHEVREIARNIIDAAPASPAPAEPAATPAVTPKPSPTPQPVKQPAVEVLNGTSITGLAGRTAERLKEEGYTVTTVGNAAIRGRTETTVYVIKSDYSEGASLLADALEAELAEGLPEGETGTKAEAVIILGTDSDNTN